MVRKNEFSQNWWASRFNLALEKIGWASRLQRGRNYARRGAVLNLEMNQSGVQARVKGSRSIPYKVNIRFKPLSQENWDQLLSAMAEQAVFTASLLSGEMPAEIESTLLNSSVSLFPSSESDLQADCSCPDKANPCKHIAAVYYILEQRFAEDPFLLFELRGLDRSEMLQRLAEKRRIITRQEKVADHSQRSGRQPAHKKGRRKADIQPQPDETLIGFRQKLIQRGADRQLDTAGNSFWKSGSMPELNPNWQVPPAALILQSHNPPADWQGPDFMETMINIYASSSRNAVLYLQKNGIMALADDHAKK